MSAENPRMSGPEEVLPPGVIRLGPHTYQNSKGEIFEEDDHGNIFKKITSR
jgi:hypothetical protein